MVGPGITNLRQQSIDANLQVGDADVDAANPVPVDATGQGDVPITLDGEVVDVDATGQGDVPITLDGEQIDITTGLGAGATIGVTTGAGVVTDAVGTLQQYLRGLVTLIAAKIGVTVADGDNVVLGTTTGAKVITDATGTVQQYLRGLIHLLISIISVKIDQTTPGTTNLVYSRPFSGLLEGGLTELIGINEEVNTDDYGGSVGVALVGTYSGEILQFTFYGTEDDGGVAPTPEGTLFIFDVDPTISAGDTVMAAAERITAIGQINVLASDFKEDANGSSACIKDQPIVFHSLATLYFVWFHTDATDINDAEGDDEQLEFNFHYRRDS